MRLQRQFTVPASSRQTFRGLRDCVPRTIIVALLMGGSPVAKAGLMQDVQSGVGYTAWELCTRTLDSGDRYGRVLNDYAAPVVAPISWVWKIDYQRLGGGPLVSGPAEYTVSTLLGPLGGSGERTAVFRPGLGCTLVPPGTSVAGLLAQSFQPATLTPLPRRSPWPTGDGAPETGGLSKTQQALLQRVGRQLFREDPSNSHLAPKNTIAVLVAKDGQLIYERYGNGYNKDQPQLGWSMTKSLTALIAGALFTDGRLDLDATVLNEWHGTDKSNISWRPLLNMAPGLQWVEDYGASGDVETLLFSSADEAGYAAGKPVVAAPGTVFNYSTGTADIAAKGLREILGSPQAVYDYYQHRLFEPLGIRDGIIEQDASGTVSGGSRGVLKPRDWLRLGQLVLNEGRWQGQTLIDPGFIRFLKAPSPASSLYGGFVWLYDPTSMPASLPHDVVAFEGYLGQLVVIIPSKNLVLVRLGVSVDENLSDWEVFEAATDLAAGL